MPPEPLLESTLRSTLEGDVAFDMATRAMYATDASVYQLMPAGVVRPRGVDDVSRVLAACREHGLSLTARGGGTSQAGQAIGRGLQLDFSKYMHHMLELQPDQKRVRVEPGMVLDELNALLAPYDLLLPLDLSTSNRATIGGMIANNSSGTRSVLYGKTLDYVESLSVMLSDGSIVEWSDIDDGQLEACSNEDSLSGRCHRLVRQLADTHAEEIDRRYPKLLRRVGGYNLDEFVAARSRPFNLSRLLVGSEGTLGLVLEATLRLVRMPRARLVLSIQFDDLLDALAAVPPILEHTPSAVELVDRLILSHTAGKTEFEPLRDFIQGDPAAVLLVELQGETEAELVPLREQLVVDLQERGLGIHFHQATDTGEQARIWKLRRAALGLSMAQPGDDKAISFVEDTAVDPRRLRDYISRFREILKRHDTRAGFYAHASVGLLHIRPVVNMKTAAGVGRFEAIAEEVADLVLEFGGALSGEHGDGLVRAPFQERMFGPVLYEAFREIKQTFDPEGLLNPGKIVDAPALTDGLRFTENHVTPEVATAFDFSDFGGIARAAEQCGGVGACRKSLTGTMCPSYMATRNECDSTRGRANALRIAINEGLGGDGLADPALQPILDLCLECKACKSECPTGVDMARLKSEFLFQLYQQHTRPSVDQRFARIDRQLARASRWPRLFNTVSGSRPGRWLAATFAGIDPRRRIPPVARESLLKWWKNRDTVADGDADMIVFPDTFSTFCEPQHVTATFAIAERLGLRAQLGPRVCCGRPLISRGFLREAAQQAVQLVDALAPLTANRTPVVFLEPSCWSALVDDLPRLVPEDYRSKAKQVADCCLTFEQWVLNHITQLPLAKEQTGTVLHHGHCHQKALLGTVNTAALFSHVPGIELSDLDSGCCGMAGSFGYERGHYEVSEAIAERVLAPAVRAHSGPVVAPGFSCRHQVQHFTGTRPLSTAEWLFSILET